jgi:hypothetical protein
MLGCFAAGGGQAEAFGTVQKRQSRGSGSQTGQTTKGDRLPCQGGSKRPLPNGLRLGKRLILLSRARQQAVRFDFRHGLLRGEEGGQFSGGPGTGGIRRAKTTA